MHKVSSPHIEIPIVNCSRGKENGNLCGAVSNVISCNFLLNINLASWPEDVGNAVVKGFKSKEEQRRKPQKDFSCATQGRVGDNSQC